MTERDLPQVMPDPEARSAVESVGRTLGTFIMVSSGAGVGLAANILGAGTASADTGSAIGQWGNYGATTSGEGGPARSIGDLGPASAIAASNSSSYVVEGNGTVWAFGKNNRGQLGNPKTTGATFTPVEINLPQGETAVQVGEAFDMYAIVTASGTVYAGGANAGALCVGDPPRIRSQKTPALVQGLEGPVEQAEGGSGRMVYLLDDGTVEICDAASPWPQLVTGLPTNVVAISSGNNAWAARDASGNIWTQGWNQYGQAGIGSSEEYVTTPTEVNSTVKFTQVYVGGDRSFNGTMAALDENDDVEGWGNGTRDQFCDGLDENETSPVKIGLPPSYVGHVVSVAEGGDETLVQLDNGEISECGNGSDQWKIVANATDERLLSATAGDILVSR